MWDRERGCEEGISLLTWLVWWTFQKPQHAEHPAPSSTILCHSTSIHSIKLFYTTTNAWHIAFHFLNHYKTGKQYIQLMKSCVGRAILTKNSTTIFRGHFYSACSCLKTTAAARVLSFWVFFPIRQGLHPSYISNTEGIEGFPMLNLQGKERELVKLLFAVFISLLLPTETYTGKGSGAR